MRFLTLIVLITVMTPAVCQISTGERSIVNTRISGLYSLYQNEFVTSTLTGKKYSLNNFNTGNTQFFSSRGPENGSVVYDGILYKNIEIQYDLYNQLVVVLMESKNSAHYISIDKTKVSSFSLMSATFVYVKNDSVMNNDLYHQAYKSESSTLYIKRQKELKETISTTGVYTKFLPKNTYYLKKESGTYKVSGKKSLILAYQNSGEIKSLLHKYKIRFPKKNLEKSLIEVLNLVDQSSQN